MIRPPAVIALLLIGLGLAQLVVDRRYAAHALPDMLQDPDRQEPAGCDIAGDFRASRILAPGQQLTFEVPVPTASVLRFSLATTDASPPPEWRLTVEANDGTGGVLAEDTTKPTHAWVDRAIDLTPWSGRDVLLRVTSGAPATPVSSNVCWAMPRFTTRGRKRGLVVIILLDTVRSDHLGLYGYERATSQALEALASDGLTFTDFTSDASWTRASVTTLFTGQWSLTHGVLARDAHLGSQWRTMAERLRAAGAHTVALSTNPNVLPFWGLARGFERFVDVGAAEWTANSDAARVLDAARSVIDEMDEWTFLYVHINDAHAPYDPPAADAVAVLGTWDPSVPGRTLPPHPTPVEVQGAIDRYDGEIHHLDHELGRFFDDLKRRDLYRASLIVVVGDHGEEFMDHGGIYHGHTLFREQLHTPLVMKLSGLAGARSVRSDQATMRDVLPTVLSVLGLPSPLPGRILVDRAGRPSTGASAPRFAATDMDDATAYAVDDNGLTLIVQTRPTSRSYLFDRRTDPREQHDIAAQSPAAMTRLQALLDARLLSQRAGWHARLCGTLTPTKARLRIESAAPFTHIEGIGLEASDALDGAEGTRTVLLDVDLTPAIHHEEVFGRIVPRSVVDQDEVIFVTDGPLLLSVVDLPTPIRVGAEAAVVPGPNVRVTRETAVAPATYAPRCDGNASLFVWYTAPAGAVPAVDEELARRLRALGYVH